MIDSMPNYEVHANMTSNDSFYQRQKSGASILCVEIGHTRIKATQLSYPLTMDSLRNIKTIEALSAPWLKGNIQDLFKVSDQNPINQLLQEKTSDISISIFGPLYNNGLYHCKTEFVPENIPAQLSQHIPNKVSVEVDTAAWAIGAMEYLALNSRTLDYPALVVTLGTGVGIAIIKDESTVMAVEYWALNCPFPRLKPLNEAIYVLNKRFLDNLAAGEENVEKMMETYRPTYNSHLTALVQDLAEYFEQEGMSLPIKSVLVGGGYSRFIDPIEIAQPSIIFSPAYLEKEGVSPDIIQLLGCLRKSREPLIVTDTFPRVEVVEAIIKPKK